jgi:hypothetical protein
MANEKISELTPGAPAQGGDLVPIARAGANFNLGVSDIAAFVPPGGVQLSIGGNTGGTSTLVSNSTAFLIGGSNITLSQSGQSISIVGNSGGGISAAIGGNTSGTLTTVTNGTLFLAGGNNITLSQNGNSITVSANTAVAASLSVSAGTTSSGYGGLTFANGSGVTWGLNNGTITASVNSTSNAGLGTSVTGNVSITMNSAGLQLNATNLAGVGTSVTGNAAITMNTAGIAFNGASLAGTGFTSTTTAGTAIVGTHNTAGLSIGVPLFLTTGVGGAAVGMSNIGNSSGNTGTFGSGTVVFAGGNNITISEVTGAGGATITISAANIGGGNFSGGVGTIGNTSGNTGVTGTQLVLAGGNNITLSQLTGTGGGTITISAPSQTNQSLGLYASSQTVGQSSSSTVDARSLTIVGQGDINVGMSAGSLVVSGYGVSGGDIYFAGNTTGQSSFSTYAQSSLNISAAGLISVGWTSNSVIISAPVTTAISQSIFATGNTTQGSSGTASFGSLLFNGGGGVSVGYSNGSIMISGATGGGGGGGGTASIYVTGNTTNNSSTSLAVSSLLFNAQGAVTMGASNGSIQVSAPGTSSLIGGGGISLSTGGSTITVYAAPITRAIFPDGNQLSAVSAPGNGSISIQYISPDSPITASRVDALVSWSAGSSATAATMGIALSAYCAIFTRNNNTLSSLSSGSTQTTYTYASNNAGQTQLLSPAIRPISCPVNVNMVPGEYFVGFNFSTNTTSVGATTTSYGQTLSIMGGNDLQTVANYAEFTAQTNSTVNLFSGMGVYTASSAGIGGTIGLNNLAATGASLSQANIALVFRNL